MAKKNEEKIELRLTGESNEEFTEIEVMLKNRCIGKISQIDGERFVSVENYNGKTGSARSIEDGLQMILEDYHLHA